jgi:iron complex outermembrane receptor protein
VGGELRYNALHVAEDNGTTGLVTNGQASQKIISFFAQDEYRPIEKLILTAGVREDSNSLVINEDPLYSPKVSALYHITDNHSVWVSSSQTYRTPDFLDHDLSVYNGYFRGSTELKPEENFTQEVGYRGLFLDQKLKADATLFSTNVKDLIILEGDGSPSPYISNNGSLTTKGAELALDYQYTDNLSFSTDYSYSYPHSKPETSNTPYTVDYDTSMSNNVVGVGARYTINKLKLDLYAKYFEGYSDPSTGSGTTVKVRGYYETFLRVSYDFKTPSWAKQLDATVYLEANNLIGARQLDNGFTSVTAPTGFNQISIKPEVTAGLKIKF